MRIRRVRIGSFGGVKNRDYRFDDGMTVLYGPNESGKTSTLEFIRQALVPSRKRSQYPERAKSDNGTLELDDRVLEVDHKDVIGDRPECVRNMDPELFRRIFAMDAHTLDDADCIQSGDLKARFLTIPGGEHVPEAIEWAEDSVKGIVGLRSNSSSELIQIQRSIIQNEVDVSESKGKADRYGELATDLEAKRQEVSRLEGSSKVESEAKTIHNLYKSNEGNIDRLKELRSQRDSVGSIIIVTEEDKARKNQLSENVSATEAAHKALKDGVSDDRKVLEGMDVNLILEKSDRIHSLKSGYPEYEARKEAIRKARPSRTETKTIKKRNMPMVIAGAVIMLAGLVSAVLVNIYVSVLAVLGLGLMAYGFMGRTEHREQTIPGEDVTDVQRLVETYEKDVQGICASLKVDTYGIRDDVDYLVRLAGSADRYSRAREGISEADRACLRARTELSEFLSPYGGEEGFRRSVEASISRGNLESDIRALERALREVGIDPDNPVCPVEYTDSGVAKNIGDLRQEIGSLESEMRAILDMTDLERKMDERSTLQARKEDILRRGAVALLADAIMERSCDSAFGGVQPDVIRTADRYLAAMTGGSCNLEVDPVDGTLRVRSDDIERSIGRWSSGLRAQVLLSVKLAIAKEMGSGQVPMILDDVLLPFDSERKKGAVRALHEVSEEMQVIMFTCDDETREIAEDIGIQIVRM